MVQVGGAELVSVVVSVELRPWGCQIVLEGQVLSEAEFGFGHRREVGAVRRALF